MKKAMKKLMAALMAVAMLCALAVPAFADGNTTNTTNITITGTGKKYEAYRLLDATNEGPNYAYTFNGKYDDILKNVTGKTTQAEVVNEIGTYTAPAAIDAFAKNVWTAIQKSSLTADEVTTNKSFSNVPQGYYLIVETELDGEGDTYSLLMLSTAGKANITVNSKESTPELTKKVKEKNDSTGVTSGWQDGADYDIGDTVPFQLTGTVSAKYGSYDTYKYVFHDKMSDGLTFDKDSVVVKIDDVTVSGYTVVTSPTDGCTFEVAFNDLKKVTETTVTPSSEITVEYNATLNDKAVIGSNGNPNEAKLEFANNPYGDGTGTTPLDKVIVFTYKLVANKVDADGDPLEGAGFTLYKYFNETNTWRAVSSEITGETTFTFKGVDAGKYKLVESTVPAGYNKADDLIFEVQATYDTNNANPQLTGLKVVDETGKEISGENNVFTTNLNECSVSTNVVNRSGTVLPTTGGIGTTIFYVVGGGLMIAAAVLLITKKRMEGKN